MGVKERLDEFIKSEGLTRSSFEKKAGLSNAYIRNFKGSIGDDKLEGILISFPHMNRRWLLTGDGEMLKSEYLKDEDAAYVPLMPISAKGGSLDDFVVSVKDSDCEKVVSPIKGADFAISVAGESMYPEYPSGSQILIKKINERAFIDWGKTYVLDTCNGTVIKRVFPSDSKDPNIIKCVSINPEYPPFEVNLSEDVYGVYRVLMLMAVK